MSNQVLSIGVIGAGGMGMRHARNITNHVVGARISAVTDIDTGKAQEVAETCTDTRVFEKAEDLINSSLVDAVVIASPDPTHAALIKACLKAGKHVLTEKPLGMSAAETKAIVDTEVAGGKRLIQVGFMREYDPAHLAVKELIDSGELGKTVLIRDVHTTLNLNHIRPLENVIVRSAVHDIHSLRWLSGAEIETVFAQWVPVIPEQPNSCRYLLAQVSFDNGSLGVIELNAATKHGYEVNVEVVGEEGSAETTTRYSPVVRRSGARQQSIEPGWLERFETAYIKEVQSWIQSLQNGKPSGPSAWDGYVALMATDTFLESALKKSPQTVPVAEKPAFYN